jgi:hypothetical protein
MLKSISWGDYAAMVIISLAVYYAFIGFRYFRWEILSLIGINKVEDNRVAIPIMTDKQEPLKKEHPEDYLPKPALEIDISPVIQSFTDEVQAYIQEAKPNVPRPELLFSLQLIASKYSVLKNADCSEELLQMVFTEADIKYPDLIRLDDLNFMWK